MATKDEHHAWNPGLTSEIPARLLPLVSLYRPENAIVGYQDAKEAADFCGLKPADMIAFRPERLIVHDLLIRVTADLSVPDGPNYEELGLNLRGMVARIYEGYVTPQMDRLQRAFEAAKAEGETIIRAELDHEVFTRPPPPAPDVGFFGRLLGKKVDESPVEAPEGLAMASWQAALRGDIAPYHRAALSALVRIVGGQIGARGRLMGDADILTRFAVNMFGNTFGASVLSDLIAPIMREAAGAEGYRFLPAQEKPFFMNVKGASASGKSTIRPQQRELAEQLDIPWGDFALISPDYWRKYLLDYESLGPDAKYGAMLTGQELEIIDKKLDAYIEAKAATHNIPHLLIDRFRFDSFTTDTSGKISSRLLTRFGDTVFLFFLITPPVATVERAWQRGISTGRYKAVDDLLYHNIEAYTGMPELFFSWLGSADKKIHFEFLDNSVALGERPRTIAYGWNDRMVVLDVEGLHNIDRFRAVNVDAERPEDVLKGAPELTFFDHCVKRFSQLTVLVPESRAVLQCARDGIWQDVATDARLSEAEFAEDRSLTLGVWG